MAKRRTTKEFIELSKQIHNNRYDYSLVDYINKEKKVDIICPIHGVFSQKAGLHLLGSGCPKCSYVYRGNLSKKTLNDFIIEAKKIHNDFFSYEKFNYVNAHTKGVIICPIHGEFEQNPNDHLQGKGCPKCNMSFLEKEIFSFLMRHKINFECQKSFEWLGKQSLDFYLNDYNIAIECQGKQHFGCGGWSNNYDFVTQKERDYIKKELCEINGVKIIYFSHFPIIYDDFYTEENTFNNVEKMFFEKIGIKRNHWTEEVSNYFTNLLINDCEKDILDIFYIDLIDNSEKKVPYNFEINRLKNNRKNGKMTFHIFEDEWLYKKEIVKSRINNILGRNNNKIYARKCLIKTVGNKESKEFLEKNHIQGNVNSKYNLGLYYQNELVSLMCFGNLRKNLGSNARNGEYELLRFCNKLNTSVIGGASKLLNFFRIQYNPIQIISYCDLRWSNGKMYEILGFTLSHVSRPNYFYINKNNKIRENRFKYRKDLLVKEGFDENKSEHDIMLERGIYRIYDCGCKVYILK